MDASTVRPPRHAHPADLPALAERDMLTVYAAAIDVPPLAPRVVRLQGGESVQIDGVSPDEDLLVIPVSHQGPLPQDAAAHLARDVFALSLVTATRPEARSVLLFACDQARTSAGTLLGGLGSAVAVELVDLGPEWTERLIEASRPAGRHRPQQVQPSHPVQPAQPSQSAEAGAGPDPVRTSDGAPAAEAPRLGESRHVH